MGVVCFTKLLIVQMTLMRQLDALTLTGGHCHKNVSVKYQVPVTRMRHSRHDSNDLLYYTEQFVDYEERTRWDTVRICCPGYRTMLFGFCEPICTQPCPAHTYCSEPNKCACAKGYEPSHHSNKEHQLICRPVCMGGCVEHSYCVAPNKCVCRTGYKDVSPWFSRELHCERVQCGNDQRYDAVRRMCVKIEMSMEELMQKVGERLTKGLGSTNGTNDASDDAGDDDDEVDLEYVVN